ncbi:MAG: hypothetical protein HZB14_08905, partial [Actinobacteria bacterium]|nr:hypothetical protein [Actinomycetota bacterium]
MSGTAEPNSTVTVYVDGSPVGTALADGSGNWTFTITPALAQGTYSITATAEDAAGNDSPASSAVDLTIDTTDPTTSIDSSPPLTDSDPTPTFTFSSNEPGGSFECRIDGGAWGACSSPHTTAALADGAHTFDVRAIDAAGNVDATPASYSWSISTAPDTTIDSAPPADDNDSTPDFSFSSNEPGGSFECRVDGGSWSACTSPHTTAVLADGNHTFDVRAIDVDTNVDPTPASYSWNVDTVAPVPPSITSPADESSTGDTTPTISGTAEANSTVVVSDGGPALGSTTADGSGNWSFTPGAPLAEGAHSFTATSSDAAGNVSGVSNQVDVTIDVTAPAAPVITGPADGTYTTDTTPTLNGTAEASSTVTVYDGITLLGTTTADGAGNWSFTPGSPLADGPYYFAVTATDAVGNESGASNQVVVTVDTTAPNASITNAPNPLDSDPNPSFEFESNEAGGTFECRVDGGAWASCTSPHVAGPLSDGAHTFEVRAIDQAGNVDATPATHSWTVDATSPQTTIDIAPPADSPSNNASFEFSASEAVSGYQCRLDGGAWGACTSPRDYLLLTEGSHTFEVRSTDLAGNTDFTPATHVWNVDTVAPAAPTIDSPADGTLTTDTTPTLTGTAEASSTVSVYDGVTLLGTTTADGSGNWTYTPALPLAQGSHSFTATAADAAGNDSVASNQVDVTIDSIAPAAPVITSPADGTYTSDTTPTISGTAEANSTITVYDGVVALGTTTADGSGNWSFTPAAPLTEGPHYFAATATDAALNEGAASNQVEVTIDTTAPSTTIDSAPPATDNNDSPSFTFSSNEPGGSFECRLDGGAWGACTSPHGLSGLADGPHTFEVRAIDVAGNTDATPASHSWTIDTTAPDTTIDSAPPAQSQAPNPSFTFSASEPGATFECRLDGGAWSACASPHGLSGLADGSHTFEVRAIDVDTNVDPTPASHTWNVDTVAPAAPVISSPADGAHTNDTTPTVSGTAEANSTVSVYDDVTLLGTATADGSGNWSYTPGSPLAPGVHFFAATATDAAGNEGGSSNQVQVTIDIVAPDTTIDAAPPADDSSNDPSFSFSASEAGSSFECRIDGGAWGSCTSPRVYTDLAEGAHTFEVRATDLAGNTDLSPASHTWNVDTVAPAAPVITSPADGLTTSDSTPTLNGTAEANAGVTVRIGSDVIGATTADGSGNWSFTPGAPLPDGVQAFSVTATDAAGNVSSQSNVVSITIDTTAPATTLTGTPPADDPSNDPSFTFNSNEPGATFECRLDGGAWGACTSPLAYTDLADGPHTFEVRATDAAGNVDATPA